MIPVTHTDLMVLTAVAGAVVLGAVVFCIWVGFQSQKMVAEAQRLTKAVGALVIQEEEKTRNLLR